MIRLVLVALLVFVGSAVNAKPGVDEPVGDWSFKTDKPVKVIVAGGSVAALSFGFGAYLERACSNIEVVNVAKVGYSAWAVMKRFEAQVVKNPNVDPKKQESWVIVLGGLNSVGNPEKTNYDIMSLYTLAHQNGFKVVGLTLSPWGSEKDKRWTGFTGIGRQNNTQKAADFVMGRLFPEVALGKYAEGRTGWQASELPDIAVDLYDSPLRDKDAELRPAGPLERSFDKDKDMQKLMAKVPEGQQKAERARLIEQARALPRWYLRPELHSFDHIHPKKEGHEIIAGQICVKVPKSWGCDCSSLNLGDGK